MTQALVRPDMLYAWHGPSLLIVTAEGSCAESSPLSGYYYREARFLRTWRVEIDGQTPWLCEAAAVARPSVAIARRSCSASAATPCATACND